MGVRDSRNHRSQVITEGVISIGFLALNHFFLSLSLSSIIITI